MSIYENLTEFYGRKVIDYNPETGLTDASAAIRLRIEYDADESKTTFSDIYARFLKEPLAGAVEALVIGAWGFSWEDDGDTAEDVIDNLVSAKDRLSALKALFVGDLTSEESEISWIQQTDVSAVFAAFPQLEVFGVRGGNGLSLGRPSHARLKSLTVETGGLPQRVVEEVCAADLPALQHLELWLGSEGYGGDSTLADLAPVLSGRLFPQLTSLALRDCEWADDLAVALAQAPILTRIKSLDLSLGNLGDQGALALVNSPAAAALDSIDIHHHYVTDAVVAKLEALGPRIDAEGQEEPDDDDDRYIAVSE